MYERSVFFWYYDGSDAKAQQVADTGATIAHIKAGGDRGIAWIPGAPNGGFARPQWDDAYLAPLTRRGITCHAWTYPWPHEADKDVCLRLLAHRWSDRLILNPESEWRVHNAASPYNTLAQANAFAREWVRDLRARIVQRFGRAPQIEFSGVPSWSDFPYEAFGEECAAGLCQHYWPDELLGGENQVEAHYRRAPGCPCIPILTACREYDDAGVLRLAASALMHPIGGFSAWEGGNSAFQAEAIKQAFAMLPSDEASVRVESPVIRALRALWAA